MCVWLIVFFFLFSFFFADVGVLMLLLLLPPPLKVSDLSEGRAVTWGYLGVAHQTINPAIAERWNADPNNSPVPEARRAEWGEGREGEREGKARLERRT